MVGAKPTVMAGCGELYSMTGVPLRIQTVPPPTEMEMTKKGVLPYLDPLPRFEVAQPGNVLRIFEQGGRFLNETGIPETEAQSLRSRGDDYRRYQQEVSVFVPVPPRRRSATG